MLAMLVPDRDATGSTGVAVLAAGRALDPGLHPGDLVVATEIRVGSVVLPCPSARLLLGALRRAGLSARSGPVTATAVSGGLRPDELVATGTLPAALRTAPARALLCSVDPRSGSNLLWRAVPVMRDWRDALGARRVVLAGRANGPNALRAIAAESDLVLVVGSTSPPNSCRPAEPAERLGSPAHLIDDAGDIDLRWLLGAGSVGILAGASASSTLVRGVVDNLAGLGPMTVADRMMATVEPFQLQKANHWSAPGEWCMAPSECSIASP